MLGLRCFGLGYVRVRDLLFRVLVRSGFITYTVYVMVVGLSLGYVRVRVSERGWDVLGFVT